MPEWLSYLLPISPLIVLGVSAFIVWLKTRHDKKPPR